MFQQLLYFSTAEAELKTRLAGARFNLIVLPDTLPETLDPVNFNPAEMKLLFERGREIGKTRFSRLRPKARLEARLRKVP